MRRRKDPTSSRSLPGHAYGLDDGIVADLTQAMDWSRLQMQPFRIQRNNLIRQFVGQHYGSNAARKKTPLNLMQMAVTIYRRQTAARAPQVCVVPSDPDMAPVAADLELAVNHDIREMRLGDAISEWSVSAMFGVGVLKVGVAPKQQSASMAHDPGMTFADPVGDDNFVCDMRANRWDRVQFIGDSYEIPLRTLEAMGIEDVKPWRPTNWNERGDEQVISMQTGGLTYQKRGYIDVAKVWDIWLPLDGLVCTFEADDMGGLSNARLLAARKWTGPETGPYHLLMYERVPGTLLPVAPVAALADLHEAMNSLFRKQLRQAERQKTIGIASGTDQPVGEKVRDSSDGDIIVVNGEVKEQRYGGADAAGLAFLLQTKELASWMGGNLDSMGGLSRAANTVGQESIIARASNMKIADMQDAMTDAVTKVVKAIAFHRWTNPGTTPTLRKKVGDMEIPVKVGQWDGNLEDFGIEIAPYSMQSRTPAEKSASILELLTQVVIPSAPALERQGKKIDMARALEIVARYRNTPEIAQIVVDMERGEMVQQTTSERPLQSPVTVRTNVRESASAGATDNTIAQLMALGSQGQQGQ